MAAVNEPASPAIPSATIRSAARAAIDRAWARAVAASALPPLPDDPSRPPIEIERPASPDHGDLATNLAMKLARPYRMAPLAIATILAEELTREAATDPAATPVASAEVAPPVS